MQQQRFKKLLLVTVISRKKLAYTTGL